MLCRVGVHQRGSHVGLADIVNKFNDLLADLVQSGGEILAHLRGDGNGALDTNDIVAAGVIGEVVDEANRGVLDIAVCSNAPEHGGLQIGGGSSGVIGVGNHDHADVLAGSIAVSLQLIGVLVAAPGVHDHRVKGSGGGLFTDHQTPALVLSIQCQLPHIHDVLRIVEAQGRSVVIVKVHAVVAQAETQVIRSAVGHERIAQAGGLIDFLGNVGILAHRRVHRHLDAQVIQDVLAVQHDGGVRAGGDGVQLAVDRAGVNDALGNVAQVKAAVGNVIIQRCHNAVFNVLCQLGVVHLENVGGLAAGDLGGQLGPVAVPVGVVHHDFNVGVLFLEFLQHLGGQLMAGLRTPPQDVQLGLAVRRRAGGRSLGAGICAVSGSCGGIRGGLGSRAAAGGNAGDHHTGA